MKHCKTVILSILTLCLLNTGLIAKGNSGIPVTVTNDKLSFSQAASQMKSENQIGQNAGVSTVSSMSAYKYCRLIVKTKDNHVNFSVYPVRKMVTGPDNHYALLFDNEKDTRETEAALRKLANVQYVEVDHPVSYDKGSSNIRKGSMGGISKAHWTWGAEKIGADYFADQLRENVANPKAKVAIVDTGVYRNRCLTDRLLRGYNALDHNTDTDDYEGHGTLVAGIVYDTTEGLDVSILPVKVLDSDRGSEFSVAAGVAYAMKQNVDVINISLAIYPQGNESAHSQYLEETIQEAIDQGITVVIASGNKNIDTAKVCPADMMNAIVVGSVDDTDHYLIGGSDYGKSLDMTAPGDMIYSTYYNSMSYESGSSMAAPHIAGVAAMLKIMYPSYTPAKIEYVLKKNCVDLGDAGWDKYYGHGRPDLRKIKINTLENIQLEKENLTMAAGECKELAITYIPANATRKEVIWTSSNPSVVKIVNNMLVGVAEGSAKVTVKSENGKVATCQVTVKTAPVMPRDLFSLKSYNSSTKKAAIAVKDFKGSSGIQVSLEDCNKKSIAYKTGTSQCVFSNIEAQQIYYYRARAYYDYGQTRVYGTWSYRRVFNTVSATTKKNASRTGVYIMTPATAGIKSFDVCFSASNETGSFVKIATVTPGKSFLFTKFQGKELTSYGIGHKFYIVLKPSYLTTAWQDARFIRHEFVLAN